MVDAACKWLEQGKMLTDFCRQDGMPDRTVFYDMLAEDETLSQQVARARELGQEAIFESILPICDQSPPPDQAGKLDAGHVAWQKLRVWTRLEALKRINPKKYGDKLDTTTSGTQTITIVTGVPDADERKDSD